MAVACHRSTLAGAANAAARLGKRGLGTPSAPIDALVISIGGNDIGFGGLVATCMAPSSPLLGFGFTCNGSGSRRACRRFPVERVIRRYHRCVPNLTRKDGSAASRLLEREGL